MVRLLGFSLLAVSLAAGADVRTDALVDEQAGDGEVAKAVEDLGDRGFASDGLESDDKGRLYLTNYEGNAVLQRNADGRYETLVYDPRVLWPDTLSLAADGHLYFTANQLHRQAQFFTAARTCGASRTRCSV
jgi:sugar lactone lactonase YvrE